MTASRKSEVRWVEEGGFFKRLFSRDKEVKDFELIDQLNIEELNVADELKAAGTAQTKKPIGTGCAVGDIGCDLTKRTVPGSLPEPEISGTYRLVTYGK